MQRRPLCFVTAAALLLASLVPARSARAQSEAANDAAAQVLYDQATAAMDHGEFALACPKLEEVVRLKPAGVGAKLTLAECYEGAGRLATAWAAYVAADGAAAKAGQADRQKKAATRAAALKDKLASLTVVVPDGLRGLAGLTVSRDGVSLGEPQWGLGLPVDRGHHVVVATAAGRTSWKKELDVQDGDHPALTVVLPEAGAVAPLPAALPVRPRLQAKAEPAPHPAAAPPAPQPRRSHVVPALSLGASVLGFGAMAVSGGLMLGAKSTIATDCPAKSCSSDGFSAVSSAKTLNVVGSVGFGVGVAGLAGFVTWLVWPSAPVKTEGTTLAPVVAKGYAGLAFGRGF